MAYYQRRKKENPICRKCKYYKYIDRLGSPYEYEWKCTNPKKVITDFQDEHTIDSMQYPECFEARKIPFWRIPIAVIVGVWCTVVIFFTFQVLGVGFHQASAGDFSPVPIVIPIVIGIIAIAVGICGSVWWYKKRL
jgi:hypothetical protein